MICRGQFHRSGVVGNRLVEIVVEIVGLSAPFVSDGIDRMALDVAGEYPTSPSYAPLTKKTAGWSSAGGR